MFKELGAFIDHVGRATGRMIGQILSDKEENDDGILMGKPAPDFDDKPRIRVKNFTDNPDGPIVNVNDEESE
ncbi:MAG: hypothetical protein IKY22_06850 [Bacteroidales bacterium]|nr:hypothetical protein [Bacteroidales bacterium]